MSNKRKRPFINDNGELEVLWYQLPKSPQEHATEHVLSAFGFEPEMFHFIGESTAQAEKTYWCSLIEAVASCNVGSGRNKVAVISPAAILELHKTAAEDDQPATFLFEFAQETQVLRRKLKGDPLTKSPDKIFVYAMDHFAPFEEFNLGEVKQVLNQRENSADRIADAQARQIRQNLEG
jgi:hypothetical protein